MGHGVREVQPGKMALALGYLDDHWMRVRGEAQRQGVVLGYHRVSEVQLAGPGSTAGDANSIVLLTEYPPEGFRPEEILVVTPRA